MMLPASVVVVVVVVGGGLMRKEEVPEKAAMVAPVYRGAASWRCGRVRSC
jgi:hypothetical protein